MPEISRFFGIVIVMYYNEHGPPHFHALHHYRRMTVEIESGAVRGDFPATGLRLVLEWSSMHRAELLENWERAREHRPLVPVAPLE